VHSVPLFSLFYSFLFYFFAAGLSNEVRAAFLTSRPTNEHATLKLFSYSSSYTRRHRRRAGARAGAKVFQIVVVSCFTATTERLFSVMSSAADAPTLLQSTRRKT